MALPYVHSGLPPVISPGAVEPKIKCRKTASPSLIRVQRHQMTPLVSNLLATAKKRRAEVNRLRKKYSMKCTELRKLRRNVEEEALLRFKKKLSPDFYNILVCQLRNAGRFPRGYRYTRSEKIQFLAMRLRGPRSYHGHNWITPTRQTLRSSIQKLNLKPGINKVVVEALSSRSMSVPEKRNQVIVVFDEKAAKGGFQYDEKTDTILGFVDLGDGIRRSLPAEETMVMMVRSVFDQWKQPLFFWHTNRKLNGSDFAYIFKEGIKAVVSTGSRVRAIVTDGLAKNKTAMVELGATSETPWFKIDEATIYTIFDMPHLAKCLRNALLKYILQLLDGTQINFKYIEQMVEMDMMLQPRRLEKITRTHLDPRK